MQTQSISRLIGQRSRWRRSAFIAGASLIGLVGTMVAPVSAAMHQSTKTCRSANGVRVKDAGICKGLAFYQGKTLTYVNIGSIGGPFDDLAIAMQPYLA